MPKVSQSGDTAPSRMVYHSQSEDDAKSDDSSDAPPVKKRKGKGKGKATRKVTKRNKPEEIVKPAFHRRWTDMPD